jgi:hypothetical protein
VKNRKGRLIYETQEEIFWLKFPLELLKLLFSARKIKKKVFPTQPEKNNVKIYVKKYKNLPITVFASLKENNGFKQFFFQIIDHYYQRCIFIFFKFRHLKIFLNSFHLVFHFFDKKSSEHSNKNRAQILIFFFLNRRLRMQFLLHLKVWEVKFIAHLSY